MGLGEKIKGAMKQGAGTVTDDEQLQNEGEAQSDKGTEQLKADKADAEAKAHEEKAKAAEQAQHSAQESA